MRLRSEFWEISRLIAVLTFANTAVHAVHILKISKLIAVLTFAIAAAVRILKISKLIAVLTFAIVVAVKNRIAFPVPGYNTTTIGIDYDLYSFRLEMQCGCCCGQDFGKFLD